MAQVFKPPAPVEFVEGKPSLFLAGSIEMGSAVDWQQQLTAALDDLDVLILNPRRDEWDASWRQSIDEPQFREQVEWELAGLEQATLIAMYFAGPTRSPITLLELGLFARSGKMIVACEEGFWRRGNIEVVCARYHVPLLSTLQNLTSSVRQRLHHESA